MKKIPAQIALLLAVICLSYALVAPAFAQDIFYFHTVGSIKLYNKQGIFQKSYPVPIYEDTSSSDLATDGVNVWFSYFWERHYIDRMPLATAPALDGAISTRTSPGGFTGGVAKSGDTVYVSRNHIDESIGNRVEMYSNATGSYLDDFETGYRSFPGSMTATSQNLFVLTYSDDISVYSLGGDFVRQFDVNLFPGSSPGYICSDESYIWVFWSGNSGYAYDFSGNRVPSEDITFEGLSSHGAVELAWGPDGPNIMTPESTLDFGSIVEGESGTLDLIIQNVGNEALTVTGAALSDTVNFSNTVSVPFTLSAGTSQTFTITFNPATIEDHSATLSLTSNDPDEATFNILLNGKGTSGQFYVNGSRPPGGNGLSWSTAFNSIDSAMANTDVLSNSEIWVREGTYSPVTLSKQVEVYGGFNGNETSRSQRDWTTYQTIIDGGGTSRPVTITADAENGVLDGFIVENGYTEGYVHPVGYSNGGGIEIMAPGFSLRNSTIRNNSTGSSGGGVYTGVENTSISNCIFSNNTARETADGGGLWGHSQGLIIKDSSFTGNTANRGGGIYLNGWSNAVYSTTIERCTIGGNRAANAGGGICSYYTTLRLLSSLIHDNSGEYEYNNGSGIELYGGVSSQFINNTIVNNRTPDGTGGSGINADYATSTTLTNNIIWANGKMRYADPIGINDNNIQISGNATLTMTFSNIQDLSYGDWFTGEPDTNNNMRKLPGFFDIDGPDDDPDTWEDNDYRLAPGSYCIDYGNSDVAPAADIYGNGRYDDQTIYNKGTGSLSYVDIGSHERQSNTPMRFYVDAAATGAGTGESWADALTSINAAAGMVIEGAEIWVRSGTYLLGSPIVMERAAALYGGFAGTETARYQRDWVANPTVLDAQHNDYRVMDIFADAVIDGFTITGGVRLDNRGGGIYVQDASPTIAYCKIQDNQAVDGGGISVYNGPSTVIDSCSVINNFATGMTDCGINCGLGGGISFFEYTDELSDTTIKNSVVAGNRSVSRGGGIYSVSGLSVINSTIVSNKTYQIGGIYQTSNDYSPFTVTNSIVWGNIGSSDNRQIIGSNDTITYSDVQASYTGTGNIDLPPQFVADGSWDNNSTPSDITDDIWVSGDYHLLAASPCIDSGTEGGAPLVDIELTVRPQASGIDIGSYEMEMVPPLLGDVDGDMNINLRDGIFSLQLLSGIIQDGVNKAADVNEDDKIGLAETIFILSHLANQ